MTNEPLLPHVTAPEALATTETLIDVRKWPARDADGRGLPGVEWIDPYHLSPDHPVLQGTGRLIFFCVHGHEVSRYATALALFAGREAAYVAGGYAALVAAGAQTVPLTDAAR